jgi:hypothetical protein
MVERPTIKGVILCTITTITSIKATSCGFATKAEVFITPPRVGNQWIVLGTVSSY